MKEYQVLARRYRPQSFAAVVGQDAVVTTLKNALKLNRTAHAYLFSGPRGTGKTTFARLFAKALNCEKLTAEGEPCNNCASCREITNGTSMDVMEIDGASNRGIEEIRKIKDAVAFAASGGRYKIYIIDEVHMLTRDAFNALLKTLEEPPANVKFFFATTEIHKVPMTIISRCQRFQLQRIPADLMEQKLKGILSDIQAKVEDEALKIVVQHSDGCLRDAESLLDQTLSFCEGEITAEMVRTMLGVVSTESFFELDRAGKRGELAVAFKIVEELFAKGKSPAAFIEGLLDHFRMILLCKFSPESTPAAYKESAGLYTDEQCLSIIDDLIETQKNIKPSAWRIYLEALLLRIMRSHRLISVDRLVQRLLELEAKMLNGQPSTTSVTASIPTPAPMPLPMPPPLPPKPVVVAPAPAPAAKPVASIAVEGMAPGRADTLLQFATVELKGNLERKAQIKS